MKVTSTKSVSFPQFAWGINKGDVRELPTDDKAIEVILAHKAISEVSDDETIAVESEPEPKPVTRRRRTTGDK